MTFPCLLPSFPPLTPCPSFVGVLFTHPAQYRKKLREEHEAKGILSKSAKKHGTTEAVENVNDAVGECRLSTALTVVLFVLVEGVLDLLTD